VIPVLNEAPRLPAFLSSLAAWRSFAEIIVVDGGSSDDGPVLARAYSDSVLSSPPGRAGQMNLGAAHARGDYLMFLHCDTVPGITPEAMAEQIATQPAWGFFRVRLSGEPFAYRIIERAISLRSRLTHVATGDQCIFIARWIWDEIGGFAEIPLMEDVEFSKRLRNIAAPVVVNTPVTTSSRRWEERGIVSTILLMWRLRFLYWLGVDPARLAERYRA
jgi:rSAM/selenodomain-associated transferase 2